MSHYVMLVNLEDATSADRLHELMRGMVDSWNIVGSGAVAYATTGQFDLVLHGDLGNDVDAAWLGALFATGGVRTCSLHAFTEDEVRSKFEARPFEFKFPVYKGLDA